MSRILSIFVIAILTAAVLAARPLSSIDEDERAVREVENRWFEALARRDAAILSAILDDRFLDVTYTGRVRDRKAAIAGALVARPAEYGATPPGSRGPLSGPRRDR